MLVPRIAVALLVLVTACSNGVEPAASTTSTLRGGGKPKAHLQVFAPENGALAGINVLRPDGTVNAGTSFFVDLEAHFDVDYTPALAEPELTAPACQNAPPFPGLFRPGRDNKFPGLVVLFSSTVSRPPGLNGPGQNLAGLFNLVGVTDRRPGDTEIWATWIIGDGPTFGAVEGQVVPSRCFVAIVEGAAPNVVEDRDGDGEMDDRDLEAMGFHVISNVKKIDFFIDGRGAPIPLSPEAPPVP